MAPGIKLNISKSGISTTVGGKGLSVNTGSRGTYLNTGIPGTGVSDRVKIGGGAAYETENKKDDPLKPLTEDKRKSRRVFTRVLLIGGLTLLFVNVILGAIVLFFGISMWLHGKIEKYINGSVADDEEEVEIPEEDEVDIEIERPQATKKESIQDMVRAALDIRSEVQAGKRAAEIFRNQNNSYASLIQLCLEIENNNDNNYLSFDTPVSVEIKYCDRDGEITNRKIDILYIAASDYNNDYYIKAFCHLRNEDRTFNIERIQKTTVNGSSVDIIQYIVDFYRNTDKYKKTMFSIKIKNRINSNDVIGYSAKILTYISRIDGIFTRKEKIIIAVFLKTLEDEQDDTEFEDYVEALNNLNVQTKEYKNIVKSTDISEQLIEKSKEIAGKDPLRLGALEILYRQYEKNKSK
jgi:hypothetical protein